MAIETVMDSYSCDIYDVEIGMENIDDISASAYKKKEMKRCLKSVLCGLKDCEDENARMALYLKSTLNISGARNLFAALDNRFYEARLEGDSIDGQDADYHMDLLKEWEDMFSRRLQEYLRVQYREMDEIAELLLCAQSIEKPELKSALEQLNIAIY